MSLSCHRQCATLLQYIVNELTSLGWSIEFDAFTSNTPLGKLEFKNIIASHNPRSKRYLDLACHYDSKLYKGTTFLGATDSAVPCAIMIQLAHSLDVLLKKVKHNELSLRLIFFDGEEAFKSWSKTDSLYGSRHLAEKWDGSPYPEAGSDATQLDRMVSLSGEVCPETCPRPLSPRLRFHSLVKPNNEEHLFDRKTDLTKNPKTNTKHSH